MNKLKSLIPLAEIEPEAYGQILNILELECLKELAIMPDVHMGYDLCIGGVALLDHHISPSFVGYDIGCGMTFINTNVDTHLVFPKEKDKKEIFKKIYQLIPVGHQLRKNGINYKDFNSAGGFSDLNNKVRSKLNTSLGTLGSGNHFIEIGQNLQGKICITIHSGSRNIGHSIAKKYMEIDRIMDLDTDIGQSYLADMNFALDYALENRLIMIQEIIQLIGIDWKAVKNSLINENHNHAVITTKGILHRKGATPADHNQLGIIPANMRDGVYITRGLGNQKFLSSASHGAGRICSRKNARENISLEEFKKSMTQKNILAKINLHTLDESPMAYKNIDTVIKYQEGIVVDIIDKVSPLINVKG